MSKVLEFNLEAVLGEIAKRKAKGVAVQVPDGLKQRAWGIAKEIEDSGVGVVLFAEPCFGACDVAEDRALQLGADLLVHFGHAEMVQGLKKTLYVPLSYKVSGEKLGKAVGKLLAELEKLKAEKGKRGVGSVALCATVQYTALLEPLSRELKGAGVKVLVGKGDNRIAEPGQVLGCNFSAVKNVEGKADAVVFVGDGQFHPLGISYVTEKPLLTVEPLGGEVKRFAEGERERFLRKRHAAVAAAKDARKFAVVMSTKPGQLNQKAARYAKELVEKQGKSALMVACDLLKPEYFEGMGIECIVSTACPRIAVDDAKLFRQPVLSVPELEILFGVRELEDYALG